MVASRGHKGSPHWRLCPLCPPEEKNGKNQLFLANFWIFAPSEMHFALNAPPKKQTNKQTNKNISGAATGYHSMMQWPGAITSGKTNLL